VLGIANPRLAIVDSQNCYSPCGGRNLFGFLSYSCIPVCSDYRITPFGVPSRLVVHGAIFRFRLVGISASKSIRVGFKTAEFIVYCLLRRKSRAACADCTTMANSVDMSGPALMEPSVLKFAPTIGAFGLPSGISCVSPTWSGMSLP